MLVLEEGVGNGTEFVLDTLRNLEPVEGTEVRSDVVVIGILQTTRARLFRTC